MDQAKLGKETQAALRENEDEAKHWRKLYLTATGGDDDEDGGVEGGEDPEAAEGGAGALGVDAIVKLQSEVRGGFWMCVYAPRRAVLVGGGM